MGDLVLLDVAGLAARTQGTVTYQIATALESSISSFLDPANTLISVALLTMYTEFAARVFNVDVSVARAVLLAQLSLSLMSAVDSALAGVSSSSHVRFLLRTYTLCLPSVLRAVSPRMLDNQYVQNAISTYVYRYAQNSGQMLLGLELGASPVYFVVLFIVMARHPVLQRLQQSSIFSYVFQGWRLLLVDMLMRSVSEKSVGAPKLVRTGMSLGLVLAVDVLHLAHWGMLQDVRGYAVFKAAQQLHEIQLLALHEDSTCAVAIVFLCARSAVAHVLVQKQRTQPVPHSAQQHALVVAANSISEIVFVGSVNAVLQDMMPSAPSTLSFIRFLWVCIVAVITFTIQKALADAVRQRN